jgi:hypothetical protein
VDPALQERLDMLEELSNQIDFDMDRINAPPEHALARSVASFPVCGSFTAAGSGSGSWATTYDIGGKIRLDPSLGVVVKAEGDGQFKLSGDLGVSGEISSALRFCIDLMPWVQYGYYEANPLDEVSKEFYEPETLAEKRQARVGSGGSDFFTDLSQNSRDFLATVSGLVMRESGGALESLTDSPLIGGALTNLVADIGSTGTELVNSLGQLPALLSGLPDKFSNFGIGAPTQIASELQGMLPTTELLDNFNNTGQGFVQTLDSAFTSMGSPEDLSFDACELLNAGGSMLPGSISSTLSDVCYYTGDFANPGFFNEPIDMADVEAIKGPMEKLGYIEGQLDDAKEYLDLAFDNGNNLHDAIDEKQAAMSNWYNDMSNTLQGWVSSFYEDVVPSRFRNWF